MQHADRFSQNLLPFTCFALVTFPFRDRPSSRMDGGRGGEKKKDKTKTAAGCVYDTFDFLKKLIGQGAALRYGQIRRRGSRFRPIFS